MIRRREPHKRIPLLRTPPSFANPSRIIVNSKRNAATNAAAFIIPSVGNNKLRHETLQRFMLINDSVTVAIEVPIWLAEADSHGSTLPVGLGDEQRLTQVLLNLAGKTIDSTAPIAGRP
jgi:hypothetical protein